MLQVQDMKRRRAVAQPNPHRRPERRLEANKREATVERPQAADDTVPGLGGDAFPAELRAMIDFPFTFSEKFVDQQGRADRQGAQLQILEFERKFVARCKKIGIPMFAHCVNRGSVEQNALKKAGFSKAGAGQSPHNFGAAVDLIHGTKGWNLTEKQWAILGHLGHEVAHSAGIRITWGGNDGPGDKFAWDPAHWELTDWRDIRASYSDGEDWDGR